MCNSMGPEEQAYLDAFDDMVTSGFLDMHQQNDDNGRPPYHYSR